MDDASERRTEATVVVMCRLFYINAIILRYGCMQHAARIAGRSNVLENIHEVK